MSDDRAPHAEDDPYRDALSPEDRAVYDRSDGSPVLTREIKALRFLLFTLIHSPEEHCRDIIGALNTLCRVIYTHVRFTGDPAGTDALIHSRADEIRGEIASKGDS